MESMGDELSVPLTRKRALVAGPCIRCKHWVPPGALLWRCESGRWVCTLDALLLAGDGSERKGVLAGGADEAA